MKFKQNNFRKFLIIAFCFIFPIFVYPESITGKVIGVLDGDTIKLLVSRQEEKIRFSGIDAPEKDQDFGQKAKQALSHKIFGKTIEVHYKEHDRYGRIVGDVYLGDRWINLEMIREGFAWHYKQYSNDPELAKAEETAREGRFGLWSDENPMPPWEFRHGGSNSALSHIRGDYCCSRNGKVFHKPDCKAVSKIKEKNLVWFRDLHSAKRSGRKPCGMCCSE